MIRFIHTSSYKVEIFHEPPPKYVALSHTWRRDEVTFEDLVDNTVPISSHARFGKLQGALKVAAYHGYDYLWVDSICVDRSSSAEVSFAVNAAWHLFRDASLCIAHLEDLPACRNHGTPPLDEAVWKSCVWFSRSWTLMEILAPRHMKFFDQNWECRGAKSAPPIRNLLSRITRIDEDVLMDCRRLPGISLGKRMSWAAHRRSHHAEDVAYSLMGIFGVNMEILYGERERAFLRLQETILRDTEDVSLLGWISQPAQYGDGAAPRGLLAASPDEFGLFAIRTWREPMHFPGEIYPANKGISIVANFLVDGSSLVLDLGPLGGGPERFGISLQEVGHVFVRTSPNRLCGVPTNSKSSLRRVTVKRTADAGATAAMRLLENSETPRPRSPLTPTVTSATGLSTRRRRPRWQEPRPGPGCRPLPFVSPSPTTYPDSGACARSPTSSIAPASLAGRKRRNSSPTEGASKTPRLARTGSTGSWYEVGPADIGGHRPPSEDDEYLSESDDLICGKPPLALDHPYLELKPELVVVAQAKFTLWLYDRLSRQTEAEPLDQSEDMALDPAEDSSINPSPEADADTPAAGPRQSSSPLDDKLFACPFWKINPKRHWQCVAGWEPGQLRGLRRHLRRDHLQLNYCPTCFDTFRYVSAWHSHVMARSCDPRTPVEMEGIGEDQRQLLNKNDDARRPPEERWYEVWDLVFDAGSAAKRPRPETPFLDGELGEAVVLVRRFWAERGTHVVSGFLDERGLLGWSVPDEERSLAALHEVVLAAMIESLVAAIGERDEDGEMVGVVNRDGTAGFSANTNVFANAHRLGSNLLLAIKAVGLKFGIARSQRATISVHHGSPLRGEETLLLHT
jgi:hypothetical protein